MVLGIAILYFGPLWLMVPDEQKLHKKRGRRVVTAQTLLRHATPTDVAWLHTKTCHRSILLRQPMQEQMIFTY
eukprot:6488680-Amphidinium_carterae.1